MGRLFPPAAQFTDGTEATPVVSGSLLFSDSGTNTAKAVFSDAALAVSLGSTVNLDSEGRMPNDAFGSGSYRVRCYSGPNGTGTLHWTKDEVDGLSSSTIGALLYPRTTREIALGVTPTNYTYPEFYAARYGTISSTADSSAAMQTAINVASSATFPAYGEVILPAGTIRCDSPLSFPSQYLRMRGQGRNSTTIVFNNVTSGSCLKAATMNYFRPEFRDFSVQYSGTTNQSAFDFTAVAIQMYDFTFDNIYINAYKNAINAPRCFNGRFAQVYGDSATDHPFLVACGPAVLWLNCSAGNYPLTKAGFRLAGAINMYGCNGPFPSVLDASVCGYLGVFGNDTTSADGFQSDFATNDIPSIIIDGCNAEDWASAAYRIQNTYQSCDIRGGAIQHNNIAQPYKALVYARKGSNTVTNVTPIKLSCRIIRNGQNAIGNAAYTDAFLFAESAAIFQDDGCASIDDFSNFRVAATTYPLLRTAGAIYNSTAFNTFQAIRPRNIDIQSHSYSEQTVTSTGANQAINCTGFSKIVLSPGAAASFDRFFFDATAGNKAQDYGRNGLLIVEATNGNSTLNHNIASLGGMRMAGGANLALTAGQVVLFAWSTNYSGATDGWIQI